MRNGDTIVHVVIVCRGAKSPAIMPPKCCEWEINRAKKNSFKPNGISILQFRRKLFGPRAKERETFLIFAL